MRKGGIIISSINYLVDPRQIERMENIMEVGKGERSEGRRRRIMDRGTDRMALITGRVKTLRDSSSPSGSGTLPSSLPSSPAGYSLLEAHHSHTQSSPGLFFQHHPIPQPYFHVDHDGEHEASAKDDFGYGMPRAKSFDSRTRIERELHKHESTNAEAIPQGGPAEDKLQASPSVDSSKGMEHFLKQYGVDLTCFNPKEINACIIASENTRVLCSIVIALLVVLSNISLPRTIIKSKSMIASKPLYVLLMTDVAIVVARLVLGKREIQENAKEEKETGSREDEPNWDGALKVLELGLVLHQTLRAIFIDCSFYMVIVICGLCLL